MKTLAIVALLYGAKWVALNSLDLFFTIALALVARALCGLDGLRGWKDEQALGA